MLDDGSYASTGGQTVPSARADLCAWAKASGYPSVAETSQPAEFTKAAREAIAGCVSPIFLLARLTKPDRPVPGRVDAELNAHASRFTRHLRSDSKIT